jgi:acetylornithine deacetylase
MRNTIALLENLIRYPSTPTREKEVIEFIAEAFEPVVDEMEFVPIPPSIVDDPDYSDPIQGTKYDDHFDIRALVRGTGGGRSLIINTHADVVPPSEGQDSPFVPVVQDGLVRGRGACDAKGQIATLWRTLKLMRADKAKLRGDLILHIVVEEENGGNGTLALVRRNERADGVLVLEPTDLKIVTASRGAVWFRVTCRGRPGHPGSVQLGQSALKSAVEVMKILEAYHSELLLRSQGILLFDEFQDPMPITFGKLHSGDWPATVPGEGILEGVLGFLPNMTKEEVMVEIREAIVQKGDPWLRQNISLEFTFRHDCHLTPKDAAVVKAMKEAVERSGEQATLSAMPASNDAWLYSNQLGIPSLVFGPGKLTDAHSRHEMIRIDDMERASVILSSFIVKWCGV